VSPRLQTHSWCRRALASPRASWHRACHLIGKSSGVATCPVTPDPPPSAEGLYSRHVPPGPPPAREGLLCHHVSHGSRPASRCGRALALPRVLWHQAHHPTKKGFGVATCPVTPNPPPGTGGLWRRHVFHGSQPLRYARAFPRRLASGSSWPHQARRTDSTLNTYKTSHTWRMASIKCVQDIDT
jgi:hypothetical protein